MVASGATIRMSRAPTMTRENTSRPSLSVPNQLSADGASRSLSGSEASGSFGTSSSPKIAQNTQKPTMIAPAMNDLERRSSASRSFVADPARRRRCAPTTAGLAVPISVGAAGSGCRAHSAAPRRTRGLRTE